MRYRYCPVNTTAATDNPCDAGRYSSSTSLKAADECTITDPGYYAVSGSATQVACPAGNILGCQEPKTTTTVLVRQLIARNVRRVTTALFKFGHDSMWSRVLLSIKASTCIICPAGTYCSDTTTTDTDIVNKGKFGITPEIQVAFAQWHVVPHCRADYAAKSG